MAGYNGEFKEIFKNDPAYTNPTYITDWFNVNSYNTIVYTVFSSNNCDIFIDFSIDLNYTTIITETDSVSAGTSTTMQTTIKASYARFRVTNIINPSSLVVQGFYLS